MKNTIKAIAQSILGFNNYLLFFSLYKTSRAVKGKYEKGFHYFASLIPDRGIILDIGANIGITAIPLARLNSKSIVYAFEPIQENFKTLKRVSKFYKTENLELIQTALGNAEGTLRMVMPTSANARMQGLSKVCDEKTDEPGTYYHVPVKRVDDIIDKEDVVSAIKIDVENFEYEVLLGAENILKKDMPIVYCELWDNEKRKKVFAFMKNIGYDIFLYKDKTHETIKVTENFIGRSDNFLFVQRLT